MPNATRGGPRRQVKPPSVRPWRSGTHADGTHSCHTYTRSKLCRHRTDSQHRESGTLSTREVTRDSNCTTPIRRVAHGTHNVLYGPCSLRFSSPSRRAARRPPLRAHATLHTRASAAPAGASPVAIFIATSRSKLRPCVLTLTHGLSYSTPMPWSVTWAVAPRRRRPYSRSRRGAACR